MPALDSARSHGLSTSRSAATALVSPVKASGRQPSGRALSVHSRKSEINRDFMKSYSPSHTSVHPGGKEFNGECSSKMLYEELEWGEQSVAAFKPTSSLKQKQVESK